MIEQYLTVVDVLFIMYATVFLGVIYILMEYSSIQAKKNLNANIELLIRRFDDEKTNS